MLATNRCHPKLLTLSLAAAALVAGCGPADDPDALPAEKDIGIGVQALTADNGLSVNGLNRNGLNRNGLNRNGLNVAEFTTWFNEDVASSDSVMRYIYGCAAAPGATLTWTNPRTNRSYTWTGVFGLAPSWAGGTPATVAEQQVVTACLAAHVNAWGLSVVVSVAGRRADGSLIPVTSEELQLFKHREAAFFGNLFTGGPVYACNHKGGFLSSDQSLARACGIDPRDVVGSASVNCAPMVFAGKCDDQCTYIPGTEALASCTWGGTTYWPITTRISDAEVFKCGDGICQVSERCGTDKTPLSCQDCGPCP